jgi:hypothetical protein
MMSTNTLIAISTMLELCWLEIWTTSELTFGAPTTLHHKSTHNKELVERSTILQP